MRKLTILFASLLILLPLVSTATSDGKSNPNQIPPTTPIPVNPSGIQ